MCRNCPLPARLLSKMRLQFYGKSGKVSIVRFSWLECRLD